MSRLRSCLVVLVGGIAAIFVRDERQANGAGARTLQRLLGDRSTPGTVSPHAVRRALVSAGSEGIALALGLLSDPEPAVRAAAAGFLGDRRCRLAVPALIKQLRDPDRGVRRAAARALGAIGDPQALPFLQRAVAEREPDTAEAALLAIRDIRSADASSPERRPPFR
jgi:HEAT repeat protein